MKKQFIGVSNILLGYKKAYPDSHRIREHWYSVKEKIKEYGFDEEAGRGENEFRYMIRVLEVYLDELYSKIMPNQILIWHFTIWILVDIL